MSKTIPLDEVRLDGKSLLYLTVAMIAVLGCWNLANWGFDKIKGLTEKQVQRNVSNL